jgi:hypothetical protein
LLLTRRQRGNLIAGDAAEGFAMDAMARFVSDHNVEKFVDQLRFQHDPAVRTVLQGLLLEEVRKLGFNFTQLSKIDRRISEARKHIRAQKDMIEGLKIEGRDTRREDRLLSNLVGIQGIFEQHRRAILDSINRRRV